MGGSEDGTTSLTVLHVRAVSGGGKKGEGEKKGKGTGRASRKKGNEGRVKREREGDWEGEESERKAGEKEVKGGIEASLMHFLPCACR